MNTPQLLQLADVEPGQTADCFVLLSAREQATTRDGKPYYRVAFRDGRRSATAMIWSDTPWFADCDQAWQIGKFYKVRCQYLQTSYGPQLELEKIREVTADDEAEGFDPFLFYRSSRFDIEEMYAELRELIQSQVDDLPLQRLVLEILADNENAFKQSPAAVRYHHAFAGGLLEHTLSVVKTGVFLADKYLAYYANMQPPLSKSLVVAGAVLHDVGKLRELAFAPHGSDYTAQGRLIGHITLGRDMIREKAAEIADLDPEMLLRLEHIIIAHQNLPEWGSPVAPHTPEALLVYFADDIDAKFHMMASVLESPANDDDEFSSRDNPLRRSLFRGMKPPA